MTTARDIIKKALQRSGVITKNEVPSGDEFSDGLSMLNDMIASWSNDSLLIYDNVNESFPLVSGQQSYTIGSGGNFNTVRPLQILSAFTRIANIDYNVNIISDDAYFGITQKNIPNSIPEVMVYDAGFPLGTITLYPVPIVGTLHLLSEKQLTEFSTLDTNVSLPAGWNRALIFNLAVELSSEYGQPVDQAIYQIANESLGKIKTAIARNKKMDMYPYDGNVKNIYSGWYT